MCIENSDVVIVINQETKRDTDEVFLAFKLLKRRYRSSESDEKLKKLDFFHHPYEEGNTIRLIDDIDLPKPISLYSLATQFVPLNDNKRGVKTTVERTVVGDTSNTKNKDFEPFEFTSGYSG